tara:strand:+ start:141 stop:632 length:492 start_codon:yes stop_codon:yes gene_type:complete
MPQLNPEFFVSQLFWLAVFFSFLFIFLWRVSLPRISTVLEKRQNKIDENLATAKELQEQAQKIELSINEKINKAKQETDNLIKISSEKLQENILNELNLLDKELYEKIIISEKEINNNKENQMKNINSEIANITKMTLEKIANIKISTEDLNNAIETTKGNLN